MHHLLEQNKKMNIDCNSDITLFSHLLRTVSVFRVCIRTCAGILQTSAVEEWWLVSTPEDRRRAAAPVSGNYKHKIILSLSIKYGNNNNRGSFINTELDSATIQNDPKDLNLAGNWSNWLVTKRFAEVCWS